LQSGLVSSAERRAWMHARVLAANRAAASGESRRRLCVVECGHQDCDAKHSIAELRFTRIAR
jgi:hypothetical protein